jgi:hypothetical protein
VQQAVTIGVVVVEYADGDPIGAQVLPDVLHRLNSEREQEEGDVVRYDERSCPVPAGLVEQEDRVRARATGREISLR